MKKKVSEYDQEIPQSQTADNPVAPRGRAAQPSQDTRKKTALSEGVIELILNFVAITLRFKSKFER